MYESGHLISTYTWPLDDTVVKEKVTCRLTRVVSKFLRRIQDYSIQDRQVLRAEELIISQFLWHNAALVNKLRLCSVSLALIALSDSEKFRHSKNLLARVKES